ncbi:NUDIX hydrolase [Flavobacterium hydrophilum]|uniref:NUDIX hydrolase n=1 Tax=Flavobacterium hydrophilum TaxID=2211445 RepID=A0A2V4C6Q7_9FLAO|nr:NUDIX domain-containing protein [Flavobacterium hydrophilum]PXY46677.1 NUDIX hydrolase [Flavobacterium hydrophilum]
MKTNEDRKTNTARHYFISIDCVIFNFDQGGLKVLLVNDQNEKENWRLPGHLISEGETIESTSNQMLRKYVGAEKFYAEQLKVFNPISQYSSSDEITIGCFALVKSDNHYLKNDLKLSEVQWCKIDEALNLNDKHRMILDYSLKELRSRIWQSTIGFNLLPEKFTLLQAMQLYEKILGIEMNKSNFRRKIFKMGLVLDIDEKEEDVSHRAAKFYKFNLENYEQLEQRGLNFKF